MELAATRSSRLLLRRTAWPPGTPSRRGSSRRRANLRHWLALTEAEAAAAGELALRAHKALGLQVYSRTDMILDKDGKLWCLEANSLPGMTPTSFVPQEAAAVGMSYGDLCEEIVRLSLAVKRRWYINHKEKARSPRGAWGGRWNGAHDCPPNCRRRGRRVAESQRERPRRRRGLHRQPQADPRLPVPALGGRAVRRAWLYRRGPGRRRGGMPLRPRAGDAPGG